MRYFFRDGWIVMVDHSATGDREPSRGLHLVTQRGAALALGEDRAVKTEKWKSAKPEIRKTASPALRKSGGPIHQLLGLGLQVEAGILMGLVPRDGGDALHEIKDALGRAAFLGQHGIDDLAGLGL